VTTVTIRDLRNHGGEVVDRASQGESVIITRGGKPVAELRPLGRPALTAAALLARWHRLPPIDPDELREDVDAVVDNSL
jgi:prevent-host-death family protein